MKDIKITMLKTHDDQTVSGRCVLNGQEWVVEPFEVKDGASATDKEDALLRRLVSERQNDGAELIKVTLEDL